MASCPVYWPFNHVAISGCHVSRAYYILHYEATPFYLALRDTPEDGHTNVDSLGGSRKQVHIFNIDIGIHNKLLYTMDFNTLLIAMTVLSKLSLGQNRV